jgi:hypothetical protein
LLSLQVRMQIDNYGRRWQMSHRLVGVTSTRRTGG